MKDELPNDRRERGGYHKIQEDAMELSQEFKKMMAEGTALDIRRKARMIDTPEGVSLVQAALVGKKVRHVFIEATFPELKGGQMYQHAHGEASGTKPAVARAFKNLLKTIPKKRISIIKATISITTKIVEDSNVKV